MKSILVIPVILCILSCQQTGSHRKFVTSFESTTVFQDFYFTPQGYLGTTYHGQQDSIVHSGTYAHIAWITGANTPPATPFENHNHRGYPTIQLQKTPDGVFQTPCYVTFWIYLDMPLYPNTPENEWFSTATFTSDPSDYWARTVLINVDVDSNLQLVHVPNQGEQQYIYQNTTIKFPQKQWVEIRAYLDFDQTNGYAKVWQDGVLVSHAKVNGCNGTLAQAHFGMYSSWHCESGFVLNDDLVIEEVDHE